MTVRMTWDEVRARRLERHALSAPSTGARPAGIVTAMAGVHAQVLSAAELGIALRIEGATRLDVREALWGDRSLVKTYGPRGTVHLLPARDLGMWVGALTALPQANTPPPDQRLTRAQTDEIVAAIGDALADAELTVDELTDAIVERTGPWAGELTMPAFQGMWPRWRQAHHEAGIRGVMCFGPNRGRKVTYTNPHRWLPGLRPMDAKAALGELVHAYLHAYGPSTPQRFAHWLSTPVTWANELFDALGGRLERVEVEGAAAWVSAGDTAAPATSPSGVRLLPYFDTYAYRVGNQPPEFLYPGKAAERVLGGNFQMLLLDGEVAGLWHQRRSGRRLAVTVEPLVALSPARREELDAQVERVGEILEARPELTIGTVTVGGHA
ncbi:winged helix DNA-binding domain-containing protein [Actinomadura rugatobispora]|uniref:Winged helix DNA-binding domain-containing protein n=1 Tax=Actinomadura rugatobispora TaxID=1994 RepID=A0ABW1A9X5_9ACTN|nr:winged helix DNA-binding domain-containing protein [Actinomadura rugatobispora]